RREAIEGFEKGGRDDRAAQEKSELALIETYLPQQMSRAEVEPLARQAIADSGATSERQMGAIMQKLMPLVKGKADGKLVNQIVKELLAK
ncbi:MAG: GatB/YqeY domain-containing protein, partial [Chloroflexota bacterium]